MNVYIQSGDITDMQGPCPTGYHVPSKDEWTAVKTAMTTLGIDTSNGDCCKIYLKAPFAGIRGGSNGVAVDQGNYGYYWEAVAKTTNGGTTVIGPWTFNTESGSNRSNAFSIRPFKDTATIPTNTWTTLYAGTGDAGIFHDTVNGLISISSDGIKRITIADKNLGATTVCNSGDTLSESNCGKYYQRGNNYGFSWTGSITTSSTKVDASSYGPGNYYSSSTFIVSSGNWDSSNNQNLRGGETGPVSMKEVKNIYIGEYESPERIEYKINADSGGRLYIPLGGFSTSGSQDCSYSWKVSVDGGTETTYSGKGASGTYITLSGYVANTNHTIKIAPTTADYGWARAYCWNGSSNYITEIVYDSSYMGYATSTTNTGDYFRYLQYNGCTSITSPAEEYLPDTVTTIGWGFRQSQYYGCTSLTYASEESLPNSITTIGNNFRTNQYMGCTALTEIKGWKDLSASGNNYRSYQFYNCTNNKIVKVLTDVGPSSSSNDPLPNSYVTSVYVPNAYLTNFKNTSNYPWVNITDSKFIGY